MKTLLEHVVAWGDESEVLLAKTENRASFTVNAGNDSFSMVCFTIEEERMLVCLCGYGISVPEEKRAAVGQEILALNFTLKWGAFQLDVTTGELVFRASQLIPTEDAEAREMVEKSISFAAQMLAIASDTVKGWLL